jgi:hypothetical protein
MTTTKHPGVVLAGIGFPLWLLEYAAVSAGMGPFIYCWAAPLGHLVRPYLSLSLFALGLYLLVMLVMHGIGTKAFQAICLMTLIGGAPEFVRILLFANGASCG